MLKKEIKYTNYNDIEVTETFYFNLTKAEVMEMEMTTDGGYHDHLMRIVAANDPKELVKEFKDLVLKAYGEKSADGKHFVKNDSVREAFSQTEAYSDIFIELSQNAEAAAVFVNGIMPKNLPTDHLQPQQ